MTDRHRALQLLRRIEAEQLYASIALVGETGFVRTVVLGVLRWRSRLDWIIEQLAGRSLGRIDPLVVDVLRAALYQLLYTDSAPYAVVSESVDLTPKRARGFVNALLRRAKREKLADPADAATRLAHPSWLLNRWQRLFGRERAEAMALADQDLSYPDVVSLTGDVPPDAQPSAIVPGVWKLTGSSGDLPRDRFHPMDEGSALIAAIAANCGDRILDLAAAPGGKTIFMTSRGARVVAADVSLSRIRFLARRHAATLVADGRTPPFRSRFPVVLLDAPCSATGTLRKSPEIKWRLREEDLSGFALLQRSLLESAMGLASEAVIYSTCSLEPEENDAVVDGFERRDITPFVPGGAQQWVRDGVLRLTQESGADGFTAFLLTPRL